MSQVRVGKDFLNQDGHGRLVTGHRGSTPGESWSRIRIPTMPPSCSKPEPPARERRRNCHHTKRPTRHSTPNGHTLAYLSLCVQTVKAGSEVWLNISAETGMSPTQTEHGYSKRTGRSSHHPDFKCLPVNRYLRSIKFAREGMVDL